MLSVKQLLERHTNKLTEQDCNLKGSCPQGYQKFLNLHYHTFYVAIRPLEIDAN